MKPEKKQWTTMVKLWFLGGCRALIRWTRKQRLLNWARRQTFRWQVVIRERLYNPQNSLNLHLGCGEQHLEGFINIDWRKTAATDGVCDIRQLPYAANRCQRIETYHVIEHFRRTEVVDILHEWHRVIEPGGYLVIECPDFDTAVQEYLAGEPERLYSIFGRQRFQGDTHFWGYNKKRLKAIAHKAGFQKVCFESPQDYHAEQEPCLRMVATA